MAFCLVRRSLMRTSKEVLERNLVGTLHAVVISDINVSPLCVTAQGLVTKRQLFLSANGNSFDLVRATRKYSKKHNSTTPKKKDDSDSESDSDDEFERSRVDKKSKTSERGDSEFWRQKMRSFHKILDVNHDGVISFEDFTLLAKRFSDIGNLSPEMSEDLLNELKLMWVETFGEITPYNLVTAEQFLTDFHHRLNDKCMAKRITKFLPFLFKAVDFDHTGTLNLEQYKLFFRCLGRSDEDAAISFAVIDQNGDGQITMKEFVHLGRQFFITEDKNKISKMFWGPLMVD